MVNSGLTLIKIRIIQELIQIRRPKDWDMNNIKLIVDELVGIERHNYNNKYQSSNFEQKWKFIIK